MNLAPAAHSLSSFGSCTSFCEPVSLTIEGIGLGFVVCVSVRIKCSDVCEGLALSCPLLGLGVVRGALTVRFLLP